jgi:hypothetical protein
MAEVKPGIGLVIRHAYLWWNEARQGREEGRKDRPCVIIHQRQNEHDETEVFIPESWLASANSCRASVAMRSVEGNAIRPWGGHGEGTAP